MFPSKSSRPRHPADAVTTPSLRILAAYACPSFVSAFLSGGLRRGATCPRCAVLEASPRGLCCTQPTLRSSREKREAERRQTRIASVRIIGCGARLAKRARLSAFHGGSFVGRRNAPVQLQARHDARSRPSAVCETARGQRM